MVLPMNEKELIGKVHSSVYHQCQRRGYAAPVDVLMDIGVLPKQKYEDWKAVFHHAPDAGVRAENWLKAFFLLLQAMGREEENRPGA